ncbi:hypothetical protein RIR_jg40783.t1 [Rhizophagus irregularis DAOM 181602=DAOM 197198]|nr:hypothetical protein RIR_jg40783.t1 [Rhizophagus irregularis DAOM 181602=DAOM 197198]
MIDHLIMGQTDLLKGSSHTGKKYQILEYFFQSTRQNHAINRYIKNAKIMQKVMITSTFKLRYMVHSNYIQNTVTFIKKSSHGSQKTKAHY